MLNLLAAGAPRLPHVAGKEEDAVEYALNLPALLGALICALLLIAWLQYVWAPRIDAQDKEDEQ